MVPIEELLKNKIVKISFAEVAEYLQQVLVEKHAQEQAASFTTKERTTSRPAQREETPHVSSS